MKTKFLLLLIAVVMAVSCAKHEDCVVSDSVKSDNSEFINGKIPFHRAIANAEFFYKNIEGYEYTPRKIKSVDVLSMSDLRECTRLDSSYDEEDTPLAYVVNFEDDKGYAILAADIKLSPVICIVDEGSFSTSDFVEFARNSTVTRSNFSRNSAQDVQYALINNSLSLPPIDGANPLIAASDTTVLFKCLPLVPTKWGQRDPYNYYAPLDNSSNKRCLAGCVPVAGAQTLAALCYHHNWRPEAQLSENYDIDWYSINRMINADIYKFVSQDYSSYALNTASLIRAVGENIDAHYTDSLTTAYTSRLVETYESFGMSSVKYGNDRSTTDNRVTKDDILNMIVVNNYPVVVQSLNGITRSDGHAFVLDGWLRLEYSALSLLPNDNNEGLQGFNKIDNVQYNFDLVHVNFGWNGNYDGYFLLGAFDLTEDVYHEYAEENDHSYTTPIIYDLDVNYLIYNL